MAANFPNDDSQHRIPLDVVAYEIILRNGPLTEDEFGGPDQMLTDTVFLSPACESITFGSCTGDVGAGGTPQPVIYQVSSAALGADCTLSDSSGTLEVLQEANASCTAATTPFSCCTGAGTGTCVVDPFNIEFHFIGGSGPSGELELEVNETCTVELNLVVQNQGAGATPLNTDQSIRMTGTCEESGLNSDNLDESRVTFCPTCVQEECFSQACDQVSLDNSACTGPGTPDPCCTGAGTGNCPNPTGGTCVQTNFGDSDTCTDTDGNVCTIAGCDGEGACDQNHMLPDSTPCDPANPADPQCATPGCDGLGACDPLHMTAANSDLCDDIDGNVCTIAGCDGVGACDQDHIFVDGSEPCTDEDGNEYTTAGCDGFGNCEQLHLEVTCEDEVCQECDPGTGECVDRADPPPECEGCLVIIDEEGIDNDFETIEDAAGDLGPLPEKLVNDQGVVNGIQLPTEEGNPPFVWNQECEGTPGKDGCFVLLPTGEVDDEGWFALPRVIEYKDGAGKGCPSGPGAGTQEWFERFHLGTLPQDCLDKIIGVVPMRNVELKQMIGRRCKAVVYDSDISMNYDDGRTNANLQGGRSGCFWFEVVDYEVPGSLQENGSSSSLVALWLQILGVDAVPPVPIHFPEPEDEPDSVEIKRARYSDRRDRLYVKAKCDTCETMWISVDGSDAGLLEPIDPFVDMELMDEYRTRRFRFILDTPVDLDGRRVVVWSDTGGSDTVHIE